MEMCQRGRQHPSVDWLVELAPVIKPELSQRCQQHPCCEWLVEVATKREVGQRCRQNIRVEPTPGVGSWSIKVYRDTHRFGMVVSLTLRLYRLQPFFKHFFRSSEHFAWISLYDDDIAVFLLFLCTEQRQGTKCKYG